MPGTSRAARTGFRQPRNLLLTGVRQSRGPHKGLPLDGPQSPPRIIGRSLFFQSFAVLRREVMNPIRRTVLAAAAALAIPAFSQAQVPPGYPANYADTVAAAKKEGK